MRDRGATGDGVADDTAAVQSAIDAAAAIRFPAGTYRLSSTITIPSNRRLFGDGDRTRLRKDPRHAGRILRNRDVGGNHNIIIENLSIDGGARGKAYRAFEDGIVLTQCSGCIVRYVNVANCQNNAIIIEYGSENIVDRCNLINNGKVGIYLSGTSLTFVSRNNSSLNGVSGIALAATKNASVTDNICDRNRLYGITCGRDSFDSSIMSNQFTQSPYAFAGVPEPIGSSVLHGIQYSDRERLYGMRNLRIGRNRFVGKVALILATGTQFEKNDCTGSNSQGILLQGSSGNIIRDNDVRHWNAGFAAVQLAFLRATDGIPRSMRPPLASDNNRVIENRFHTRTRPVSSVVNEGRQNQIHDNALVVSA